MLGNRIKGTKDVSNVYSSSVAAAAAQAATTTRVSINIVRDSSEAGSGHGTQHMGQVDVGQADDGRRTTDLRPAMKLPASGGFAGPSYFYRLCWAIARSDGVEGGAKGVARRCGRGMGVEHTSELLY